MMKSIVVAGHIALDITPEFLNQKKCGITELFRPGELTEVGPAAIHTGGAVSNTGLALHRLGTDVVLLAKTGADAFGSLLRQKIEQTGCRAKIKVVPGETTSYTLVFSPKGIDRLFFHHAGCNNTFTYEDVDFDEVAKAAHFHLGYPPLMRKLYQNDGKNLVKLFRHVKELGVTTSLDMAAIDPESEAGQCDWKRILERVLPYVDFFVPSVEEFAGIMAPELLEKWRVKSGNGDITSVISLSAELRPLAQRVMEMGAKVLLLKCGAAGMYLRTAGQPVMESALPQLRGWPDADLFEPSYLPDRVRSATGAGDTSIAAFLKAALEGFSPGECLQYATATGACCVSTWDAVSGLRSFAELRKKIDGGWQKQHLILP